MSVRVRIELEGMRWSKFPSVDPVVATLVETFGYKSTGLMEKSSFESRLAYDERFNISMVRMTAKQQFWS